MIYKDITRFYNAASTLCNAAGISQSAFGRMIGRCSGYLSALGNGGQATIGSKTVKAVEDVVGMKLDEWIKNPANARTVEAVHRLADGHRMGPYPLKDEIVEIDRQREDFPMDILVSPYKNGDLVVHRMAPKPDEPCRVCYCAYIPEGKTWVVGLDQGGHKFTLPLQGCTEYVKPKAYSVTIDISDRCTRLTMYEGEEGCAPEDMVAIVKKFGSVVSSEESDVRLAILNSIVGAARAAADDLKMRED